MDQYISQGEVSRIIISDIVKKGNSIVPVIGEDTIVYKDIEGTDKEILLNYQTTLRVIRSTLFIMISIRLISRIS